MSGIVGKNLGRGSGIVTATPVGADTVSGASIVDDAIDSEHYADGSIDNAHIADDAIDSEHYADGSIDNAHIADDAIDSEHYADGSIDEAHIADNAVTLAKMAGGTDGNIISYDASGDPVAIATGDDGQVLTSTGAGSPPAFEDASGGGFTLASEQATTSGTGVTFGSIPTGTKLILVMFEGCSDDAGGDILVTIGDSGGLETSGYVSSGIHGTGADENIASGTSTAAFLMKTANTSCIVNGIMTLALKDSSNYTWVSSHSHAVTTGIAGCGGGVKSLSAELTQVSIRFGGASFDAGSINILYQ